MDIQRTSPACRHVQAVVLAILLACISALTCIPASIASANPDRPVSVTGWYSQSELAVEAWACDGLANEAWNVAFEVDGANGTFWVQALSDGEDWSATIPVSQIGIGSWTITALANIASEPVQVLGTVSGYVPEPSASLRFLYDVDENSLMLGVWNLECPTGVQAVSAGITSPSGLTIWCPMESIEDLWFLEIDPFEFGFEPGFYAIDVAIADNDWQANILPRAYEEIEFLGDYWGTGIADDTVLLWLEGTRAEAAWNVAFCVDGSNGTFWVQGIRHLNESTGEFEWEGSIDPAIVGNGSYTAWPLIAVGSAPLTSLEPITVANILVDATPDLHYNIADDVLEVTVYDPQCFTGSIEAISVGLTGPDGTCEWFPLVYDGYLWAGRIPADVYGYMNGIYAMDVAVADTSWNVYNAGRFTEEPFGFEALGLIALDPDGDGMYQEYVTAEFGRSNNAWNAAFEIMTPEGPQWLQAVYDPSYRFWRAPLPSDLAELSEEGIDVTVYLSIGDYTVAAASDMVTRPRN